MNGNYSTGLADKAKSYKRYTIIAEYEISHLKQLTFAEITDKIVMMAFYAN